MIVFVAYLVSHLRLNSIAFLIENFYDCGCKYISTWSGSTRTYRSPIRKSYFSVTASWTPCFQSDVESSAFSYSVLERPLKPWYFIHTGSFRYDMNRSISFAWKKRILQRFVENRTISLSLSVFWWPDHSRLGIKPSHTPGGPRALILSSTNPVCMPKCFSLSIR